MTNSLSIDHQSPDRAIRCLPFSEGCLLFQPDSRKIWTLNHAAALIWSLLEETADLDDLAAQVARTFRISQPQARKDTETAVASFRAEGLLGTGAAGPVDSAVQSADPFPIAAARPVLSGRHGVKRHFCYSPHHYLELRCVDPDIAREFQRAMCHFEVQADGAGRGAQLCVAVRDSTRKAFDLYLDGRLYAGNIARDDAGLALLHAVFFRIAAGLFDQLLFHAAVLERAGKAFLFPGEAGSGKTTIAALLCKRGYGFVADELAVVDPDTGSIMPLPLPMSIKKGALSLLRPLYPELDGQESYVRADGKEVRILVPEVVCRFDRPGPIEPMALVFPRYDPGAPAAVRSLAKADAIRRLAATCSSSRPLAERDIAAMIRLVDGHPCFSASYSDCATVEALLEDIVQGMSRPGNVLL